MKQMQTIESRDRPKGASIWTVITLCLMLAILGLGGLGYALYHANSEKVRLALALEAQQNTTKRLELAAQKAAEQGALTLARNQQEQLLAQVSAATNSLQQLLAGSARARDEAAALATNEAGRAVALHPELVRLAGRVFESSVPELPPAQDILTRLEAVRRIGQQVADARGTTYGPVPASAETVQQTTIWAGQGVLMVGQIRDALSSLVRESKIKYTTATLTAESPALAAAITTQNQAVARAQLATAEQTVSAAQTNAIVMRAEAEAARLLADARRDAAETHRKQLEEQAAKDREWQEREAKIKEAQAAKERELDLREARLKVEEAKKKVAVQDQVDKARNVVLRKKAEDPALQAKLAPFITPGYSQIKGMTIDLKPLSYTALQNSGALDPAEHGLRALVTIALSGADKVRPRWKMNRLGFMRHPDEIQQVKEAQSLLIELGPVLVEMGQLQP